MKANNSTNNKPNPPLLDEGDVDSSLASLADAVAATAPFVAPGDDAAAADESVPSDILELWANVGQSVELVWTVALEALTAANRYLPSSVDARHFCDTYVGAVVQLVLTQYPTKIAKQERKCLRHVLAMACAIVVTDLNLQLAQQRGICTLLDTVLVNMFHTSKNFYRGQPNERLDTIEAFRAHDGFQLLYSYLLQRVGHSSNDSSGGIGNKNMPFPELETVQSLLAALLDTMHESAASTKNAKDEAALLKDAQEVDAIHISQAVMLHLSSLSDDALKRIPIDLLSVTVKELQRVFTGLLHTQRPACIKFYAYWQQFVLALITSSSLLHNVLGWEQVNELIKVALKHRPPPRMFVCSGAGTAICNGEYHLVGVALSIDGVPRGAEDMYVRVVPSPDNDGLEQDYVTVPERKLTLFRCNVRNQRKRWFISEADEEQPGSDQDVDYYKHGSVMDDDGGYPPPAGWMACQQAGLNPPPQVTAIGVAVPEGDETQTLEYHLACWMIENKVVELSFSDVAKERAAINRAVLVDFVSFACTRYPMVASLCRDSLGEQYAKARAALGLPEFDTSLLDPQQNDDAYQGAFPSLETMLLMFADLIFVQTAPIHWNMGDRHLSRAALRQLSLISTDVLALIPAELLSLTLKVIVDRSSDGLLFSDRAAYMEFHTFWQRLVRSMITSQSLAHRLAGWEQVNKMIKTVVRHRTLPKSLICSGAGLAFCNGEYHFAGAVTRDGHVRPGSEIRYVRDIHDAALPSNAPSRTLAVVRGFDRNQPRWWSLLEVDAVQQGPERDMVYYQNKSEVGQDDGHPPMEGWHTCRNAGVNPPPTLLPVGFMVPEGEELQTLEHQLACWMIENKVLELLLRDSALKRTDAYFSRVFPFLTSTCKRNREVSVMMGVSLAERFA